MKRRLTKILLCCITASFLFGCGNNNSNNTEAVANENTTPDPVVEEVIPVVTGYTFDIPEGFLPDETSDNCWNADDESGARIQYSTLPFSESIYSCSADSIKSEMETQFSELGYEITVSVDNFEKINVEGYDGYRVELSYLYGNTQFNQLQYIMISTDLIGSITYTDINESGWMEAFEKSAASIHIVTE